MHEMQAITTDVLVCQSVMQLHSAYLCKTAEWIEVLFGVDFRGPEEHYVRHGS